MGLDRPTMTSMPETMTVAWVQNAVDELKRYVDDDEVAHGQEDTIHALVLQAIASGICEDTRRCAEEALKTDALDFSRWCA